MKNHIYFKDQSVPVRFPSYDFNSDPALKDGTWGPWIPSSTNFNSTEETEAYENYLSKKLNFVDLSGIHNDIE